MPFIVPLHLHPGGKLQPYLPSALLIIKLLTLALHEPRREILIMPKHQLRVKQPLQPLNHLQTPYPRIMVSCQPPMRMTQLIVLRDMELVCRPDPGPALLKVDLHHAQPRGVPWRMMQRDTLVQVKVLLGEGVPFEFVERHIAREVNSQIGACPDGPARVLEFLFVHVDGDVGAHEGLQAPGVVEM